MDTNWFGLLRLLRDTIYHCIGAWKMSIVHLDFGDGELLAEPLVLDLSKLPVPPTYQENAWVENSGRNVTENGRKFASRVMRVDTTETIDLNSEQVMDIANRIAVVLYHFLADNHLDDTIDNRLQALHDTIQYRYVNDIRVHGYHGHEFEKLIRAGILCAIKNLGMVEISHLLPFAQVTKQIGK